jgi:hypothetical protein
MTEFKLDKRAIDQLGKDLAKQQASELQKMFDRLERSHRDKPVDEVKRALKSEWERTGGKITDPELTSYATEIAAGTHIRVTT